MLTEGGRILTSVSPEVINASAELCMETGAILEAHKLNTSSMSQTKYFAP